MEEDLKKLEEYLKECEEKFLNGSEVFGTELYTPIKNILSAYKKLEKDYKVLREYISYAPNLDEMTATKYTMLRREAYIEGRADEQRKAKEIINNNYIPKQAIRNKIDWYKDYQGTVLFKKYNYEEIIEVLENLLKGE